MCIVDPDVLSGVDRIDWESSGVSDEALSRPSRSGFAKYLRKFRTTSDDNVTTESGIALGRQSLLGLVR